jgi:CheY-like chemotaxis protein
MTDGDRSLRILSIDDDALNRVLLRASLAAADDPSIRAAAVVDAASIAEAREALAAGAYDLVLLDRRLPDGDGFDIASELGAAAARGRPRIVAVTADAVPATRDAAMRAGCDAVVTKPYRPRDLVAVLVEQLRSDQPQDSLAS